MNYIPRLYSIRESRYDVDFVLGRYHTLALAESAFKEFLKDKRVYTDLRIKGPQQ